MAKTTLTIEEISEFLKTLSYKEFKAIVEEYSAETHTDLDAEMKRLVTLDLQNHLEQLNISTNCPNCASSAIVRNGRKSNGIREFKCTNCGKRFTLFSGTILEKTRWHWDIWIKVLEMTLNNYSIEKTVNVLEKDYGCTGINVKTVWLWRHKLIHALAAVPMPILTGVIQVDETFIRESQKDSRELKSTLNKLPRRARYGRKPSFLGTMGPEFATVTTAIDNRGYCVCKVTGLGKLTAERFVDLFENHFDNPSYLCSDANDTYKHYCKLCNVTHNIRPSGYVHIIQKNGYETPDPKDPELAKKTRAKNRRILQRLYKEHLIDRISGRDDITYAEFYEIKKKRSKFRQSKRIT